MTLMEVITLTDDSDVEEVPPARLSFSATVSILNEKPLDLASALGVSASTPAPAPLLPVGGGRGSRGASSSASSSNGNNAGVVNGRHHHRHHNHHHNHHHHTPSLPSSARGTPPVALNGDHLTAIAAGMPAYGFGNVHKDIAPLNGENGLRYSVLTYRTPNGLRNGSSVLAETNRKRLSEDGARSTPEKRQRLGQRKTNQHKTDHYYVCETKGYACEGEEFSGQFRCTAFNCNKILPNNVSFIHHMWAHCVYFMSRDFLRIADKPKDVNYLLTCPYCLAVFESAYDKTKHYMEMHRGVLKNDRLCHMCELDCHPAFPAHPEHELPFECGRKCRFKSSSRQALIHHFTRVHIGTTLLICPFCSFTSQVSNVERNRGIAVVKGFVNHMMDHTIMYTGSGQRCDRCSYKFANLELLEKHFKNHSEDRKLPVTMKETKELKGKLTVSFNKVDMINLFSCSECRSRFSNGEHFAARQKCPACKYETACEIAFWRHRYLGDCFPENAQRKMFSVEKGPVADLPKISAKKRRTLTVCRSPAFVQMFRLFRDFDYDRPHMEKKRSTQNEEARQKEEWSNLFKDSCASRKLSDMKRERQDEIAVSIYSTYSTEESVSFAKGSRIPFTPLFKDYLASLRQRSESDSADS